MSAGDSLAGVMACLLGGLLNSTWPLFVSETAPKLIGLNRNTKEGGWAWENSWFVFTFMQVAVNIAFCVAVLGKRCASAVAFTLPRPSPPHLTGTQTLAEVYAAASTKDLSLVCFFSFMWGFGVMFYSLGIRMLGAGLGIALQMSLLTIIGTLLPLIEDYKDDIGSPAAIVTIIGLVLGLAGFVCGAYSSSLKDYGDPEPGTGAARGLIMCSDGGLSTHSSVLSLVCALPHLSAKAGEGVVEEGKEVVEEGTAAPVARQIDATPAAAPLWLGIAVCVAGAVTASMLQFSFVYGSNLVAYAEEELGVAKVFAPLVVWLLAFSLAGMWNVVYASWLLTTNRTWKRFPKPGGGFPGIRYVLLPLVMGTAFVAHIHLYGVAQALFGNLGEVISWPLLMTSTVLCGHVWGYRLGEWKNAPRKAITVNIVSTMLLIAAVAVIAVAGGAL
ncbi:unnamed protein product [Chrysoparadoxa australica]